MEYRICRTWINNTYNILLRFIDHKQFFNLLFSTFIISSLAVALLGYVLPNLLNINFFLPRFIPFLFFGTLFILLSNFRFVAQQILNLNTIKNINKTHVLIYGADENGYKIYNTISKNEDYNIIGFIDNDRSLQSTFINNKKVLGNLDYAIKLKSKYENLTVYLNDPSLSEKEKINIFLKLNQHGISLRTIPSIPEFSENSNQNLLFNELPIHILIGRREKIKS